jgi:phosphate transport system permease protein
MMSRERRRRVLSTTMTVLSMAAVLIALVPLALILFFVVSQGVQAISLDFFTSLPAPAGRPGGGMANAIVGTLMLCGLAAAFAIPVGVMMSPVITRTTEELLRLVPMSLREGALALGATQGRTVFSVVLPAALPGIITGIVLALARIAGETAPLLFTALNNHFWSTDLGQPIASLTVQVYNYAISPYPDWHRQAWAGALVLVTLVLLCSILARVATRRLERMHTGR